MSEWTTPESREFARRVAVGGEAEGLVLGACCLIVYRHSYTLLLFLPFHFPSPHDTTNTTNQSTPARTHHTAALLATPEAQARRTLLDARKREAALGSVLSPHLPGAMAALLPAVQGGGEGNEALASMGKVAARMQALLATLDLARPLPPFLSSRHVRALCHVRVCVGGRGVCMIKTSIDRSID